MNEEKSKLAKDLSKIRTVESLEASAPSSKDDKSCHQVVDVDSNVQDPQFCCCYAASIYDNIHVAELDQRPSTSYIDPNMCGILIGWLVEVSEEYKLASDTLS